MSQPLAVAAAPVFASFRARTGRDRASSDAAGDAPGLDHRLDLVIDRLDQLEFTVGQLVAPDPDGGTDRLAMIEARIEALHETLERAPLADDPGGNAAAIDRVADEIAVRQDAMLDMLATLAPSAGETTRLADAVEDQARLLGNLPDAMANLSAQHTEPATDAGIDALTTLVEQLCQRQATAQALTLARFAEFERKLADEVFETLAFRVSRLVDARLAGGFARLADALDAAADPDQDNSPSTPAPSRSYLDDPRADMDHTQTPATQEARALVATLSASCRAAAQPR